MVTVEELEQRVRLLELNSHSEKQMSFATLEKIVHVGGAVNLMRLDLSQHGGHIVGLQQDVTVIRNETVVLRRGQEEIQVRVDRLEGTMNARFDAMQAAMDARFAAMHTAMDDRFAAMQTAMDDRFAAVLEAIRSRP